MFNLQLLSQCGSTCNCLSRFVPEIHQHVAGTLSKQPTDKQIKGSAQSRINEEMENNFLHFQLYELTLTTLIKTINHSPQKYFTVNRTSPVSRGKKIQDGSQTRKFSFL